MTAPPHHVETIARQAYGRLLAILAVRTGDVAACEDALADAFTAALRLWPEQGLPQQPEAWLLTVARNRLRDHAKHHAVRGRAETTLMMLHDETEPFREDHRVRLMFACAHPAIDVTARTPLMLQVVLGLTADAIAPVFLASAAGMAKRLVRAKAKIKRAGIPFELPDTDQWRPRLGAVLDAIYAAYGRSWDYSIVADAAVAELRAEAIQLAEVIVASLPMEPEPRGLLALMLYAEARRPARIDAHGRFVPLDEQDPARWDAAAIARAEALLRALTDWATFERYQLEAAISSCHVARIRDGRDDPEALEFLYRTLHATAPSQGAWLGWCAARARRDGPEVPLRALIDAEGTAYAQTQSYWALRAELHRRAGQDAAARAAFAEAIDRTADDAVRAWLESR